MSKKLLLADDSITIQKVVGIIFANEDYELSVVDNGDAALEKARQIVPDIILVDALMPGKNGYEVCAGIRQDPKLSAIPLLLMTGAFEPFDEDKAKQSGADDFISKPFESQQLIDRVQKLIEMGKARGAASTAGPTVAMVLPEPAAPPVQAATASAVNDLAQAFAVEPVLEENADEVFALGEEAVEGSLDDDLWGAFEIDDLSTAGAADFGVVEEQDRVAVPAATSQLVDDAFSFADINEDLGRATAAEAPVEVQPVETGWEPVDEQSFAFQEEEPAEMEPLAEPVAAVDSAFDFAPEADEPAPEMAFSFEDAGEAVEELTSPVTPEPAPVSFAAGGESAPPSQQPVITEAQLAAALSGISREIIEKIVWEVVPDLAEALIKEEIRKLKEGSGS
ncbi:response regulator [Geotalea sp. SG265]|uniref:response regulator n=1 Tax=Geotalea sp. SG265 TaxID=2922867 RepID=UPI001FB02D1F|nr:response regulator [Geotalea sp. SG265]